MSSPCSSQQSQLYVQLTLTEPYSGSSKLQAASVGRPELQRQPTSRLAWDRSTGCRPSLPTAPTAQTSRVNNRHQPEPGYGGSLEVRARRAPPAWIAALDLRIAQVKGDDSTEQGPIGNSLLKSVIFYLHTSGSKRLSVINRPRRWCTLDKEDSTGRCSRQWGFNSLAQGLNYGQNALSVLLYRNKGYSTLPRFQSLSESILVMSTQGYREEQG